MFYLLLFVFVILGITGIISFFFNAKKQQDVRAESRAVISLIMAIVCFFGAACTLFFHCIQSRFGGERRGLLSSSFRWSHDQYSGTAVADNEDDCRSQAIKILRDGKVIKPDVDLHIEVTPITEMQRMQLEMAHFNG